MSAVDKIEREIQGLPLAELAALRKWFREFDAQAWDKEIEDDLRAGRLDALADKALDEFKAGGCGEL